MQFITSHSGKLQTVLEGQWPAAMRRAGFVTGLEAVDSIAPGGQFARGAVHELLAAREAFRPITWAAWMGKSAAGKEDCRLPIADCRFATAGSEDVAHRTEGGHCRRASEDEVRIGNRKSAIENPSRAPLLFVDPERTLYPPALVGLGIDLARVYLLRPRTRGEALWVMAECLRCAGVGAVVGWVDGLSRLEARRLQLAAEGGGTVGVLMRPRGRGEEIYAAATRWVVGPARGERTVRRWRIQLVHGHGGRVGECAYVEQSRESAENRLRAVAVLGDRSGGEEVEARRA